MRGLAVRVAKASGEPAHNVEMKIRRQLLKWLAHDVQQGLNPTWMYRAPHSRTWRINLSALRAAHKEFFEDPLPQDLEARIEALETEVDELKWARDTMATEIGKLRGAVEGRAGA
jgi:hypothetical protein